MDIKFVPMCVLAGKSLAFLLPSTKTLSHLSQADTESFTWLIKSKINFYCFPSILKKFE